MKENGEFAKQPESFIEAYTLFLRQPPRFIIDAWYAEYRKKMKAICFIQSKGLYEEFRKFVK